MQKNEMESLHHTTNTYKINSQGLKTQKLKQHNSQGKTGENHHELEFDKGSLDLTPNAKTTKEKLDNLNFIKIKIFCALKNTIKKCKDGTSLVVQWLRLHAPKKGAQVQSLVRELNPTCCN